MNKTIETIVLVGALGLAGCHSKSEQLYKAQQNVTPKTESVANDTSIYTFNDFGNINSRYARWAVAADMDGDGDQDIIAIDGQNRIIIYKNNIPQKNKK